MSQALTFNDVTLAPSVSLHSGRPATTSRDVAKVFGKRHDHTVACILRFSAAMMRNTVSKRGFAPGRNAL